MVSEMASVSVAAGDEVGRVERHDAAAKADRRQREQAAGDEAEQRRTPGEHLAAASATARTG